MNRVAGTSLRQTVISAVKKTEKTKGKYKRQVFERFGLIYSGKLATVIVRRETTFSLG